MFGFLFKKKEEEEETEDIAVVENIDSFDIVFNYLYNELGIDNLHKRPILHERLGSIAKKYRIKTAQEFVKMLKKSGSFYEEVIDAITVNETYFLREIDTLRWLVRWISDNNKDTKILSIPSSNGAEIYSVLMMLDMQNTELLHKVKFIGIDINNESIKKAKKGIYSERELHKLDDDFKGKYFKKRQKGYELEDFLKKNTEFANDNIFTLSASKYGAFDVVLSRNLFIYFDDLHRKKATAILYKMLKPGGYLIMGVVDRLYEESGFKKVSNSIYQKI